MWLGLALLSCLLWAVVYVLDAHVVERVIDAPWLGVAISAAFAAAAIPLLLAALLWIGWVPVGLGTVLLAVLAGMLFAGCQLAHFQALRHTESGIVAAYWGLTPVFVVVGELAWFREPLTGVAYAGIGILVTAAISFGLLDTSNRGRWPALGIMTIGCLCQAAYFVVQKVVFKQCPAFQGSVLILTGLATAGLSPLAFRAAQRSVRQNLARLRPALRLLVVLELCHLLALLLGQAAVDAGTPSLVAAVEGTVPAFTFLLSIALFAAFGKYGEPQAKRRLPGKLLLAGVMCFGIWLVS